MSLLLRHSLHFRCDPLSVFEPANSRTVSLYRIAMIAPYYSDCDCDESMQQLENKLPPMKDLSQTDRVTILANPNPTLTFT